MSLKDSSFQLIDLPDEILIYTFKKLDNITLLYSLSGVNIRLNEIVHDFIFTSCLPLVVSIQMRLIYLPRLSICCVHPLPRPILDRYCFSILPAIRENVKWLHLEHSSIERILRATTYPNLCGIALYNIQVEAATDLFFGKVLSSSNTGNYSSTKTNHCS